jgi:hypothetical protein
MVSEGTLDLVRAVCLDVMRAETACWHDSYWRLLILLLLFCSGTMLLATHTKL